MNHFSMDMLEGGDYVEVPTKTEIFREKRKWERKSPKTTRSQREVGETIGTLAVRPSPCIGLANQVRMLAPEEGPLIVSIDAAGAVFATPIANRRAVRLWADEADSILGVYDEKGEFKHLYIDLHEHREAMRRAL